MHLPLDLKTVRANVKAALLEDIGSGDLTGQLAPDRIVTAKVITREQAVLCGSAWFNEVFSQIDKGINIDWHTTDGQCVQTDITVCTVNGSSRSILAGERTALNFLQTLSGTATITYEYSTLIDKTAARLLDTRKTIPGLRLAQKYAVSCGGGHNHRLGLYDGILIKENHLRSGERIGQVLGRARSANSNIELLEIEVESLAELKQALEAGANRVLLDNFNLENLRKAVVLTAKRAELEASGNITRDNIRGIADTGVDYISIGAITKHLKAIDFSLLFID